MCPFLFNLCPNSIDSLGSKLLNLYLVNLWINKISKSVILLFIWMKFPVSVWSVNSSNFYINISVELFPKLGKYFFKFQENEPTHILFFDGEIIPILPIDKL